MVSVTTLVIILSLQATTFAEEDNIYYNNGWKPLSSEKVLENLYRKFIKTPETVHSIPLHWDATEHGEDDIGHIGQNVNVNPSDVNRELMSKNYNDNIVIDEKFNQVGVAEKKQNYNSEYLSDADTRTTYKTIAGHRRQPKNIIENYKNKDINILESPEKKGEMIENITQKDVKLNKINIINEETNVYEVTEASESSEIKNLLDGNQGELVGMKPYIKPNHDIKEKNLSDTLLRILGDYNIKYNDDLSNYAKSRSKLNSNFHKQSYVYSSPIRIAPKWNSENNFPLDPILAVFLSNYGYYLPGSYGFPGNYYNIYGYLASNNIHNNKPFGAYKIYSDTDSSN